MAAVPRINALLILDSNGRRLAAKYYGDFLSSGEDHEGMCFVSCLQSASVVPFCCTTLPCLFSVVARYVAFFAVYFSVFFLSLSLTRNVRT